MGLGAAVVLPLAGQGPGPQVRQGERKLHELILAWKVAQITTLRAQIEIRVLLLERRLGAAGTHAAQELQNEEETLQERVLLDPFSNRMVSYI